MTGSLPCAELLNSCARWSMLLALSVMLVAALTAVHLPAALLVGPMMAAILFAAYGKAMSVHRVLFLVAQGIIGCMIARVIPPQILSEVFKHWPLFLVAVFSVIAASSVLGLLLTRFGMLPGTTAVWGAFPGAATTMMIMAEAYGADIRLVAFMQYLRVLLVVIIASMISRIWLPYHETVAVVWFPPLAWMPFIETLLLVGLGILSGLFLRIPAGPMLVPLAGGILLQATGVMVITLPPWLLASSYGLLGWSIGLRFNRAILVHASKAFPKIAVSILCLIAICGGFSAVLVSTAGISPLTAYLAMSPGGADSIAIIAASNKDVDIAFIMTMQTMRFLVVLLAGPAIARFIASRAKT